ncbi:MAG: hypothetical protein V7K92_22425 [Nostoc sp.]|uniref:hypothetical protein n=1 Tax=Nostoc sp. TaxID=1180 RepID=UPI002FF08C4D
MKQPCPYKGGKQEIQFPALYKAIAGGLWVWFPASDRETRNPVPSRLQGDRRRVVGVVSSYGKQEIQFPRVCKAIVGGLGVWFPASDREIRNPVPSPCKGED